MTDQQISSLITTGNHNEDDSRPPKAMDYRNKALPALPKVPDRAPEPAFRFKHHYQESQHSCASSSLESFLLSSLRCQLAESQEMLALEKRRRMDAEHAISTNTAECSNIETVYRVCWTQLVAAQMDNIRLRSILAIQLESTNSFQADSNFSSSFENDQRVASTYMRAILHTLRKTWSTFTTCTQRNWTSMNHL
ncbi:hypothetical protein BT63DRAFT_461489 [Microthyrium microscopicum]|uniref:Uncharacterized protein n=1 Tax=Microthyrium microscopicum TaxID=703497 RepID=A0A6A6TVM6_9PEZI|nr:hypothetical protein BT63DRAFT_461489 [Microthyrium microscopicum]